MTEDKPTYKQRHPQKEMSRITITQYLNTLKSYFVLHLTVYICFYVTSKLMFSQKMPITPEAR